MNLPNELTSIILSERFFAVLFASTVLLTAILAGLDFAVTEAILGLSLVAVQRMFVQLATAEGSVDARPTLAELPAVCQRPRVLRPKERENCWFGSCRSDMCGDHVMGVRGCDRIRCLSA
ncbi:hypothetical protein FOZ63_023263 [Perkinsus olseni]|uniref:Uncharacterized protein n=1 Tax=Perkinsus olseni TaxID=32597 RepID=A0A7J6TX49_PEROL|nr:hypothetical protein FOZ62_027337 [Perkinsus olseni]KAF4751517.1 hypothetical protein FOZ63_023263 [Perkinsus olseni]